MRMSHPAVIEKTSKYKSQTQRHGNNLSGEEGDFSISSMSGSSHRGNKSTLNNTTNVGGGQGAGGAQFGQLFSKNYFVDGEQLLRHISPSQPTRSPRDSANDETNSNHCINILKVSEQLDSSQTKQTSGKRSKTTRGVRP